MRTVYSGPPEMAALLRGALRSRGIWAELAEVLSGARHQGASEVFVNDEDETAAQEIVRDFVEGPRLAEGAAWTWRCPSCGEIVEEQFGACWNCGAEREQT